MINSIFNGRGTLTRGAVVGSFIVQKKKILLGIAAILISKTPKKHVFELTWHLSEASEVMKEMNSDTHSCLTRETINKSNIYF